jgi:hypothetical protein
MHERVIRLVRRRKDSFSFFTYEPGERGKFKRKVQKYSWGLGPRLCELYFKTYPSALPQAARTSHPSSHPLYWERKFIPITHRLPVHIPTNNHPKSLQPPPKNFSCPTPHPTHTVKALLSPESITFSGKHPTISELSLT